MPSELVIRDAVPDDAVVILRFIRELAAYEREPQAVETSVERLREQMLAPRPPFECLIAEEAGEAVGFALFFQSYSTWRGRPGLYLEDLYVTPARRRFGIGRAILSQIAALATVRGYGRVEWAVLDWNQPAIDFYLGLGAQPMTEWTVFRLHDAVFATLSGTDRGPM